MTEDVRVQAEAALKEAQAVTTHLLPEPKAGGNYLRDPVTGALTLNPDYPVTDIPQE